MRKREGAERGTDTRHRHRDTRTLVRKGLVLVFFLLKVRAHAWPSESARPMSAISLFLCMNDEPLGTQLAGLWTAKTQQRLKDTHKNTGTPLPPHPTHDSDRDIVVCMPQPLSGVWCVQPHRTSHTLGSRLSGQWPHASLTRSTHGRAAPCTSGLVAPTTLCSWWRMRASCQRSRRVAAARSRRCMARHPTTPSTGHLYA